MSKLSATITIDAPFHDIDQMGIVWHGHYLKYFEIARCELLKLFDYDYPQMAESGYLWPIVDVQIKYIGSIVYDQPVKVTATLVEYENRLRIDYRVKDPTGKVITKGQTTQVCVKQGNNELEFYTPELVIKKIEKALNET